MPVNKDIPWDSRLAFHVYRIVTRIPLPSCFSHIQSADPRPRHHSITLTCQSKLPLRHFPPLLLQRSLEKSTGLLFIDLVYLRGPVSSSSIPRDLFLLPSLTRTFCLSPLLSRHFDTTYRTVRHHCDKPVANLASLSFVSSSPSSFDKVFSFCSAVSFTLSSLSPHIPLPLKRLASSTDIVVSSSPRSNVKKKEGKKKEGDTVEVAKRRVAWNVAGHKKKCT